MCKQRLRTPLVVCYSNKQLLGLHAKAQCTNDQTAISGGFLLEQKMKKSTLAALAAFFMGVVLAVVAPTIDAVEQEQKAQAEQIRAASEAAEAEAAWQEAYGSMSNEERLQGVVYEE